MKINKTIIIRTVFAIWIVLWVNFILRDLFRKGYFYDYMALIKRGAEGKRSYVYGDYLYPLLRLSKQKLPFGSTYRFIDDEEYSINYRRAVYYLYPLLQSDKPDYILVYNSTYRKKGYTIFAELDSNRYILKRTKNKN